MINYLHGAKLIKNYKFPLVEDTFGKEEIDACISTLKSGQITMGKKVRKFESDFAKYLGVKYAVFCNSGSSANLLSIAMLTNKNSKYYLPPRSKIAVPAVCWSTSVAPIIQLGFQPILVDVNPLTLNLSIKSLKNVISNHDVRALMLVHILGNSTNLDELLPIVKKSNITLIEDTCESLGSEYKDKKLGTIGKFGTFSFYFSHHLTTIEGGMIVTNEKSEWDILKSIRAHGWSREYSNRVQIEKRNILIDPRFLFINLGYNVRPTEINASCGLVQLKKLNKMNLNRVNNVTRIKLAFQENKKWKEQLIFPMVEKDIRPVWFGFPIIINPKIKKNIRLIVKKLKNDGIDTRPIVSGNMAIQPMLKDYIGKKDGTFPGAQIINDYGIFIGCHTKNLESNEIKWLVEKVLDAVEQ